MFAVRSTGSILTNFNHFSRLHLGNAGLRFLLPFTGSKVAKTRKILQKPFQFIDDNLLEITMIVERLKYAVLNEVVLCQACFEGSHSAPIRLSSGRALMRNPVPSNKSGFPLFAGMTKHHLSLDRAVIGEVV